MNFLKCNLVSTEGPGRLGLLDFFGTHSQPHLRNMFVSPLCIAELLVTLVSQRCPVNSEPVTLGHIGAIWRQSVMCSESIRAAQALQKLARFGSVGTVSLQSAGCDALCPAQTHERLLAQVTSCPSTSSGNNGCTRTKLALSCFLQPVMAEMPHFLTWACELSCTVLQPEYSATSTLFCHGTSTTTGCKGEGTVV